MNLNREEAEEQLKTIRRLMERSTIYRSISAPAALLGGTMALVVGIWTLLLAINGRRLAPEWFFGLWVTVLVVAGVFNALLLIRSAQLRREPFVTPALKHALTAICPPLLAGGLLSWVTLQHEGASSLVGTTSLSVVIWILGYALALLATAGFAPKSMRWLAWSFFLTGMLAAGSLGILGWNLQGQMDAILSSALMVGTFGFMHFAYAIAVYLAGRNTLRSARKVSQND